MLFFLIVSVYKKLMLNYVYLIELEIEIYLVIGFVIIVIYGNFIIFYGWLLV